MYGYAGKILYIDLTHKQIEEKKLDTGFARQYIGGLGFGTRIYLDLIKDTPEVEALSPENPFVLMTGPLTGIKMNAVARRSVTMASVTVYTSRPQYFPASSRLTRPSSIRI